MKKRFLLIAASALLFAISLYVNNNVMAKQCHSGGPGASECTMYRQWSAWELERIVECTVKCQMPQYYACCNSGKSCICLPMPTGPDGSGGTTGGDGDHEGGGTPPPPPGEGNGSGNGNATPPQ